MAIFCTKCGAQNSDEAAFCRKCGSAFDGDEGGPVPTAFVAVTLHRYVRPLVSPFTMIGLAAADAEPLAPPSVDVQDEVYPVIGLPPSLAGAANATFNDRLRLATTPMVGALGTVPTNVEAEGAEGELVPRLLVTVTVHV